MTKMMIANSTPATLIKESAVCSVLGSVKILKETTSHSLCNGLQHYFDSQKKQGIATSIEYWPLIRVVRIYCKSPVLGTGAVLVDLPGLQNR